MSVTYGFYNSSNGDRKYNALQMSQIFDGIINDGIYMSIGDKLMVSAGSGMTINVGTGRAWFNHTWTLNDATLPLPVTESDLLLPRIDAVILEVNEAVSSRTNSIKIITGEPSSNPTRPTLTNDTEVHQYPLAYVTVPDGATSIIASQIENCVGTDSTPFVTGIIDKVSVSELLTQWQSQWSDWTTATKNSTEEWLESIQNILSDDAAANLAAQLLTISPYVKEPYHGTFYAASWGSESDGSYSQTVQLFDSSSNVLNVGTSTALAGPVTCDQTSNFTTNEALAVVINLMNKGYTTLNSDGTVTCKVSELPVTDVVAYWDVKGVF